MMWRHLSLTANLMLFLANGCATALLPGGADEVSGPLRDIELYTKRPERGELYPTAARERLFASDRAVYVALYWSLPGAGDYVSKVVLRAPAGAVHRESEYRFRAEAPTWLTAQRIALPQGEAAQPLAGRWRVEVSLDGTPVGWRTFTFDSSSIRLRTDARLVIVQGKGEFGGHPGEWRWRYPSIAKENTEAASRIFGVMFRDELARRFPIVEGPQPPPASSEATVSLTPNLLVSPDLEGDSRLELEVTHLATKAVRSFRFKSSAGREKRGYEGVLRFDVEGADLAAQAASSQELLEFLITATQAVPE